MRKNNLSAFSLVELLVVIGIIAVLMSMLMPALNRAQDSAKQVQCASQLRQVGNALMAYASNNRGYYPGWSGWQVWGANGTGDDEAGLGWTEIIQQYMGPGIAVYHCPMFSEEATFDYFISSNWLAQQNPRRTNLQVGDIKKSTEFILSGDCTQVSLYPPPFGDALETQQDCDHDDSSQEGIVFFGEQGGRNMHRAGNNVLFADNHVMPFKFFDPEQMTYDPHKSGVAWKMPTNP